MRIIQISDTHISARHAFFDPNIAAIKAWLLEQTPNFIIHTGDVSMDGAGDTADFDASRTWLGGLPAETLCVPGNHDVGDVPALKASQPLNDLRLANWRSRLGPDRWWLDRSGWRLIGINAMLLGTGAS